MTEPAILAAIGLLLGACVGDYFLGEREAGSGSGDATTDAGAETTTAASATSPSDTTSLASDATGTASSTSTSVATMNAVETGSESDGSSSEGSNTGDGVVAAFGVPGGLDRIWIVESDETLGRCTAIVLVWPMPNGNPEVALPQDWSIESAWVSDDLADCAAPMGQPPAAVAATSVTGTVTWVGEPAMIPCELDVALATTFDLVQPWVPAGESMIADAVAVAGC